MRVDKTINELIETVDAKEVMVIVEEFPEINYVLVKRNTSYQPWVAAWGYSKEKQCWGQGHYFSKLDEAMRYILDKQMAKKLGVA